MVMILVERDHHLFFWLTVETNNSILSHLQKSQSIFTQRMEDFLAGGARFAPAVDYSRCSPPRLPRARYIYIPCSGEVGQCIYIYLALGRWGMVHMDLYRAGYRDWFGVVFEDSKTTYRFLNV
jgi:hypothetical protein